MKINTEGHTPQSKQKRSNCIRETPGDLGKTVKKHDQQNKKLCRLQQNVKLMPIEDPIKMILT